MSDSKARHALAVGTVLRQYRIEKLLGQGGFGITYLAFDNDLQRKVAIKECFPRDFVVREENTTVLPTSSDNEQDFAWALKKFLDEATTLARFKHPGIVHVLQILKGENNSAYMVLEYVDGQSLEAWLKGLGRRPTQKELLQVTVPLLDALELVHDNNLAHRDIAPDNIYIRENGEAVLLDFGAAKQTVGSRTRSINLVVKDGYSAPEQYYAEGRQGPWTDIYSLCATLYRAISGKRPPDSMARLDAIQNDLDDPLATLSPQTVSGYDGAFLSAIHAGLAPQAKNRPQDIRALRALLPGAADDPAPAKGATDAAKAAAVDADRKGESNAASKTASTPSSARRSKAKDGARAAGEGKKKRSNLGLIVTAASVVVAAAIGTGYWFMEQGRERELAAAQQLAWQTAQDAGTPRALEEFIASNPTSPFLEDASEALAALRPWSVRFGGPGDQFATAVDAADEVIVVSGYAEGGAGTVGLFSLAGTLQWEKAFDAGDVTATRINDVRLAADGSVFVVGEAQGSGGSGGDGFAARLSAEGELIWQRALGGAGDDRLQALALVGDDILAVGATASRGMGGMDGWTVRLDRDGALLEEGTHGTPFDDGFTALAQDAEGNVVLGGFSIPVPDTPANFWLLKLAASGATIFDRRPGGADIDRVTGITAHPDGRVIIVGETRSFGTDSFDGMILELTPDNRMPPKVVDLERDDSFLGAVTLGDGDVLIVGRTESLGAGQSDAWINRYSADLNTVSWERVLGGPAADDAVDAVELADGSIVFVGTTRGPGSDEADIWIERISGSGAIAPSSDFASPR